MMPCPCCGKRTAPSLDMVVEGCLLGPMEEAILTAVWRGRGQPVPTERIFQALQSHDPHNRPSPADLWVKFKFGLNRLRRKLAGSGVAVENCGYARGYRVTIAAGGKSDEVAA